MKATSKTTFNSKVQRAMKKLQAAYNVGVNKIVDQTKEKATKENLIFLIDLTTNNRNRGRLLHA